MLDEIEDEVEHLPCGRFAPWLDENQNKVSCVNTKGHRGTHMTNHGYIWDDIIYITGSLRSGDGIIGKCTCNWSYGPTTYMVSLANEIQKHVTDSGHRLRDQS